MVTIMPLRGEALQKEVAAQDNFNCGIESTGWVVSEGGIAGGYLLYSIPESRITRLSCTDIQLADGLLKAAADFAFRAGIGELICADVRAENEKALKVAGFIHDGVVWTIDPGKVYKDCQKN